MIANPLYYFEGEEEEEEEGGFWAMVESRLRGHRFSKNFGILKIEHFLHVCWPGRQNWPIFSKILQRGARMY